MKDGSPFTCHCGLQNISYSCMICISVLCLVIVIAYNELFLLLNSSQCSSWFLEYTALKSLTYSNVYLYFLLILWFFFFNVEILICLEFDFRVRCRVLIFAFLNDRSVSGHPLLVSCSVICVSPGACLGLNILTVSPWLRLGLISYYDNDDFTLSL